MSRYDVLWEHISKDSRAKFTMSFDEIERVCGEEINHSFLNYKKELLKFGFSVGKISLKNRTVEFIKTE